MEGFKPAANIDTLPELGDINQSFPNQTFPIGTVHEFLSQEPEDTAATVGFISGILSVLMSKGGAIVWISLNRSVFPPALAGFGIQPERCIFLNVSKQQEAIWAMEEALKCGALNAVVAELKELNFTNSRRLQLAVEESNVTGFVIRTNVKKLEATACVARWKISQLPSVVIDDLPGVGFPSWRVQLLRMRNGKPGEWHLYWSSGNFAFLDSISTEKLKQKKAG